MCVCIYWRRQWHPTPVLLPGKSHGWRSLVGCSPRGLEESDTTERLHFHFSLSCIGEGNGNPPQCSCLENPRDGQPGGLQSMGLHRVGHDWSNLAAVCVWYTYTHRERESAVHQKLTQYCKSTILQFLKMNIDIDIFKPFSPFCVIRVAKEKRS